MTSSRLLTLTELVRGVERDGMRYHALDVFAWHVRELRDALEHGRLGELQQLDREHPERAWFGFRRDDIEYEVEVHESGVARVTRRSNGTSARSGRQLAQGVLGGTLGSIGEPPGVLLGFLVGETLGNLPDAPRRVLTIRYDEDENTWRAYDGPLAKWIREQALKTEAVLG